MVLYITCFGFLVIGPLFLLRGLTDLKRARESVNWPITEAEVTSSGVEVHSGGHSGRSFEPVIRYRYQHQGVSHEGKRIKFSGVDLSTTSQSDAERFVSAFPAGTRISVRVCPSNPGVSVIEPGRDSRVWIALVIGSVLTCVGLAGLLGKLR